MIKTSEIELVASGFNTNIDAVVKIKGSKLSELAEKFGITLQTIKNCSSTIDSPNAAICGIIKCFIGGIAEEWLTSDISIDRWIENTFGTDKLQMGGQAGIIANVLALTYIKNIFVNTASHPKMLSEQFIKKENLKAIDETNKLAPAYKINRKNDMPPIHRIIEFDKGDTLTLGDKTYTCPKSNRFIATYDPLNAEMLINNTFKQYLLDNDFDYFIFAGYNLLSGEKGLKAAEKSAEFLQNLRKNSTILHLEVASTQDKNIRRYMLNNIAPLCDSLGLNERETLEAAEVLLPDEWKKLKDKSLNVINLIETLLKIKEKTKVKRLQLHIFGLYLCLQDKDYKFSPPQSLSGMLCASVAAASKAQFGYLNSLKDLTLSLRNKNMKIYFEELQNLAQYLHKPELTENGFCEYLGYDLIAVPTILVDNPKTLVGMGDTISSLSLICAR
jgi:ADP-dependent phosphofructokinase/glucokinase